MHMYIHVHVCTFVSRTSESELISLKHIACSNINTDGYSLILHTLDCDDCTILCVHTVEHTKRVEKLLKIVTKRDIMSNLHNTLDRTKWLSKTSSLAQVNGACCNAAWKLWKVSVYVKNSVLATQQPSFASTVVVVVVVSLIPRLSRSLLRGEGCKEREPGTHCLRMR